MFITKLVHIVLFFTEISCGKGITVIVDQWLRFTIKVETVVNCCKTAKSNNDSAEINRESIYGVSTVHQTRIWLKSSQLPLSFLTFTTISGTRHVWSSFQCFSHFSITSALLENPIL